MISAVPLPPPVHPGDRVGVAALSGPVDPIRLEAGLTALTALGFEPCLGRNLLRADGYLAGSDEERLEAFHELAADPALSAIFFARGGYGVLRILDRVDWALLAAHPRAYVGYSDLTPFLHEVVRRLGFASFHGPMVAADMARGLSEEEVESLLGCLRGDLPRTYPVRGWLGSGQEGSTAEGPLLGGCLSMVSAAMGTPFELETAGGLIFLEDVQEPLYRLDRMLTQLRLAGAMDRLAGVVLGHLDLPHAREAAGLEPLLADRLAGISAPIAWGLPSGHSAPNLTLPFGVLARLDFAQGLLVGIS